jgi:uncharacterized protein
MIVQPTSLCPLSCTYCYLPERHRRQEMTPDIAEAIAASIPRVWYTSKPLEIVWHGGEPLALGRTKFEALLAPFEPLRSAGLIQHKVQTGATLISDAWCDLFMNYQIGVGVSIDGPESVNAHRVDRRGQPMHHRIVAGIEKLKEHDIPFSTLTVVTSDSMGKAREILTFLDELGCTWVGLNVEAREAANINGEPPHPEDVRRFWREVFEWCREHPRIRVREVEHLLGYLGLDETIRLADAKHDLNPTIAWNGDVVLVSPELLGVHAPQYDDFIAGNIRTEPLASILARAADLPYVQEFTIGIERCKATCEFFAYCQGAHAGNRYFEHGTFTATETDHCRAQFQAPVLALTQLSSERIEP